jgi:hypothetical protein
MYMLSGDGDEPYTFFLTIKDKKGTSFTWELDDNEKTTKGTILHTAKALADAQAMNTVLKPGTKKLDDKTLSLWLSQVLFNHFEEKRGTPIKVYMSGMKEPAYNMGTHTGTLKLKISVDGKDQVIREEIVESLVKYDGSHYERKDNSEYFTYYPDKSFPLILRMSGDFTIELLSVTSPKKKSK